MRLFRQKLFVGFNDGFGGKKGLIKRSGKKSDAFKKFGPWKIRLSDLAEDEYQDLEDNTQSKVDKILKELETKPYQGNFGQHPLWEFYDSTNECVVWSAEIDNENRITYFVYKFQNYILTTNIGGHKVIDQEYSIRPKI